MSRSLESLASEVSSELFGSEESIRPWDSWSDLGRLLEAMEDRGCYLMTNSVADPGVRRMASFHRHKQGGYPCVGSSNWGGFETLGEAVLRAAHEALISPR